MCFIYASVLRVISYPCRISTGLESWIIGIEYVNEWGLSRLYRYTSTVSSSTFNGLYEYK